MKTTYLALQAAGNIYTAKRYRGLFSKQILVVLISMVIFMAMVFSLFNKSAFAAATVSNWWPTNGATISGVQPFKGLLDGWGVNDYNMYWSVDDGANNLMPTNYTDYPHKEASVDVSSWNWQSSGQYKIAFTAKSLAGSEIARTTLSITVPTAAPPAPAPTPTPITKIFKNDKLYVEPSTNASRQASLWRVSRPADAAMMDKLASKATAKWFGGWNTDVKTDVSKYVSAAAKQSSLPVLVAYNVPQRDCGGYSAGGTQSTNYINWIKQLTAGIAGRRALVILEPDSIANIDCMSLTDQANRLSLLSQAVTILKASQNTFVYIDGGHARWISADIMADRMKRANISAADGFSLNVSNFILTSENEIYGKSIADKLSGKHFVIDTSRNGLGPTSDNQWCNPAGRAIGLAPSTQAANPLVDAYLWIKTPGESDGACNGSPSAGEWMPEYALGLARRAAY